MKSFSAPKKSLLFTVLVIGLLMFSGFAYSGSIMVKPGNFDHFAIQLPDRVKAGESFMVRLQVYDAHNNLISNFEETGKDFRVAVSGSAQVQPSILKAVSFAAGNASISITNKKAETITLSIFEVGGTVPVLTKDITILPNKLDHFFVQAPQFVTAGSNFDIKIIARDAFQNPITDVDVDAKNLRLTSSGSTVFKTISAPSVFRDGISMSTLSAEKTGEASIEVRDQVTGSKGVTSNIKVSPAMLSYFKVFGPKETVAGEPFEVVIKAFDAFDNLVDNYSTYGSGVVVTSSGKTKISPSFINHTEFKGGQATVKLRYEKAEEISVIVTENNKTQQGKSTSIIVHPSAPDNFAVITPDSAIAGQKFKIKLEAYDKFGNLIRNYNLVGSDVYLNVTGKGKLSPRTVLASEFVDGIAVVDVIYDKAETFLISASMFSKAEEKKPLVQEHKEEKVTETPIKSEVDPVPKPKPIEKTEKPKPAQKEEKVAVSKPEKEQGEKKKAGDIFEIKKISLIEAKNKAMVIINMNTPDGNLEYNAEKKSLSNENFIKLVMKQSKNKAKKEWRFKSSFIPSVRIEQDKKNPNTLEVSVRVLSKDFEYEAKQIKDLLVISVTKP